MAKVNENIIIEGISGKLGKRLVFRHMKDGRTIIATRPNYSNHKWTPDQQTHHGRFKKAAAYARDASKTKPLYAELARGTSRNAYNLALSDWFHPPVIDEVRWEEGHISVRATDNVLVTKVLVTILDKHGQTLEQREATPRKDGWWEYKPVADWEGNVTVEAFDLAGNVTKQDAYHVQSTLF